MMRLLSLSLLILAAVRVDAQSSEQIERLAALGKVWGFVKYFHPGVAAGRVQWDSALVATVPRAKEARTGAEFRSAVQSLLDAAGPLGCTDNRKRQALSESRCRASIPDSTFINLDLRWLEDTAVFGPAITERLARIRDNRYQGSGRYVRFDVTALFDADTAFESPAYPGEGQRLLALFRFWNAARYYFPYLSVNGGAWNAVLLEFIPRMIAPKDAAEYHLAIAELTTRVHDAHVTALSPTLNRIFGTRMPAFEARFIDGQIVVWKPAPDARTTGGLQAGDVITHVNGQAVAERRRELAKYVAAGNDAVFERKLVTLVLRSRDDSATYTIEREGKQFVRRVAMARPATSSTPPTYPVTELAMVLPNTNIGYINMGNVNPAQVDSAIAIVGGTDGIIMDVRNYPRGTMYKFAEFLNPDPRPFAKFTTVDSTYPGRVVWHPAIPAGRTDGNRNSYRGRVAILVDERTQSHAEFTAMALRTAPQSKVIGSQTAGADGNVTFLSLPGDVQTLFSGLGVYYPDGTPTQRVGIVPDIEVRPTLKGVRAGRDEVLDRALEYIRTGR
jgi:carboxyl-terminal processing protease